MQLFFLVNVRTIVNNLLIFSINQTDGHLLVCNRSKSGDLVEATELRGQNERQEEKVAKQTKIIVDFWINLKCTC